MTIRAPEAELAHLEVLRTYKRRFGKDPKINLSPFERDQIVRLDTDVGVQDVPEIHQEVRQRIAEAVTQVRAGHDSQIVILAGQPGMGKSHLINHFRSTEVAKAGGYVLVGNSNHWKCSEFEACLLDWILDALVRPGPDQPNLLREKIEDVAFQALAQLLSRPGEIDHYVGGGRGGRVVRLWRRLAGSPHARFQKWLERRDATAFRHLDFRRLAGHVCGKFLHESAHPFHRYVVHVLLRYLFPEDRELVVHWLRRRTVEDAFLKRLGAADAIDANYKQIETIKVLISLFTDEVASALSAGAPRASEPRIFFFAFDQPEGRDELFDNEGDWPKFFAQLSELYSCLPNVFILFTMTTNLSKRLYPAMEAQFLDRIRRDRRFSLHEVESNEVLALYRRHIETWLGEEKGEVDRLLAQAGDLYLPFDQAEVLRLAQTRTLREMLRQFDESFRARMLKIVDEGDPVYDYRTWQKEIRREEPPDNVYPYTIDHLRFVRDLFKQFGPAIAAGVGLEFGGCAAPDDCEVPKLLELYFGLPDDKSHWVRVYVCRLSSHFNKTADAMIERLAHRQRKKNLLFLLRNKPFRVENPLGHEEQIFADVFPASVHTDMRAMLNVLANKEKYKPGEWSNAEKLFLTELNATYVSEILKRVGRAIQRQLGKDEPEEDAAPEPADVEQALALGVPAEELPDLEAIDEE
jgi:hypothetical protein